MIDSELNSLVKAERRERAQLSRSSSLLDLSTAKKDQRAAGSRRPSAAAEPVPSSQRETGVGGGASTSGFSGRQRRVTLDVAASKRLPCTSLFSKAPSLSGTCQSAGVICRWEDNRMFVVALAGWPQTWNPGILGEF